jgi:Uri superfamily endonuclease
MSIMLSATITMLDFRDLPASRGVYVLQLYVAHPQPLMIGRLGQSSLPVGHYFYVGSAQGAGGLRARVGRHLRGAGTLHWHIDYLRAVSEVQAVFYTVTDRALECEWSQALVQLPHAFIPVPHFGASDCRSGCAAHLVAFPRRADSGGVQHILDQAAGVPLVCLRFRKVLQPAACFRRLDFAP